MSSPRVLVTFDAMRYPNTGLYSFGKSLGKALLKQNDGRFDLEYFLYPGTTDFDADEVDKSYLKKYNKFFFLNKNNIQLFHFTDQLSRLKPQKVSGKKVMTIHDINQLHENISEKRLIEHLNKLSDRINACHRIVAISNFTANDLLHYFPDIKDKLSVIYNGADKLQVNKNHIPGYVPNRPFLFTIGIVSAKKNFHVLPSLLAGNDYELIIAGIKTPYEKDIMQEAKNHGVAHRVKITGPVSETDKAWYYHNCEAFVFPSIAEGFGLPVIEALHFGKPVFCSADTSLPEIGGDFAYYFNDFSTESMQQIFKNGMQHFKLNDRTDSVIKYAERFNWDHTAQQYLKLYKECLAL